MAEFTDLKVITKPFMDGVTDMQKRTDRATMWAVREAGRVVKRQARKRAPVYNSYKFNRATGNIDKNVGTLTMAQLNKFKRATGYKGSISNNLVISGLLKGSISGSRRLKSVKTGEYSLKVGPRGQRVHLYSGKAEDRYHYMREGYAAAAPALAESAAKGWARAMAKKK